MSVHEHIICALGRDRYGLRSYWARAHGRYVANPDADYAFITPKRPTVTAARRRLRRYHINPGRWGRVYSYAYDEAGAHRRAGVFGHG